MILNEFPEFKESYIWKEYASSELAKESFLNLEMSEFSEYTIASLNGETSFKDFKKIFDFVEMLIKEGDQEVKDAVTTCFLEHLLNFDSAGRINASSFVHFLGPESRAYCKAWDEFTGVKTPGLWGDE